MKSVFPLVAAVLMATLVAGCAQGAPQASGSMPYWGPGSPPREEAPPAPELPDIDGAFSG